MLSKKNQFLGWDKGHIYGTSHLFYFTNNNDTELLNSGPRRVKELDFEEDLRKLMTNVETVFYETGVPMFPCALFHLCIPFGPACFFGCNLIRRKIKLDELIEKFNSEIGNLNLGPIVLFIYNSHFNSHLNSHFF